jgi:hypothetical protein
VLEALNCGFFLCKQEFGCGVVNCGTIRTLLSIQKIVLLLDATSLKLSAQEWLQ